MMGVREDLGCHWQRQGNMVLNVFSSVECVCLCVCVGGGWDSSAFFIIWTTVWVFFF